MKKQKSTDMTARIPSQLDQLFQYSTDCGCGRVHSVELKGASIRDGAIDDLIDYVREVGCCLPVTVVVDTVTRKICGEDVVSMLRSQGYDTSVCIVPDGPGGRPHANEKNVELVEKSLKGSALAVAVGSGTINDLTKLASFNQKIPYIVVATAPSMNGYTSAIAAIMRRGVKRTEQCNQPLAVVADLSILCKAPRELIVSGLGDLESKPTSTADYRLSGLLRGSYYCSAPEAVVMEAEKRAAESAAGLAQGDKESIKALTEALILSGLSMKLAGSSSPASGGEHLISHHWDMTADQEGRVEGWHGSQVGVTTIVTSALYDRLRLVDSAKINIDEIVSKHPTPKQLEPIIRQRHGKMADEVVAEFFKKHPTKQQLEAELKEIKQNWTNLWTNLDQVLRPSKKIKEILKRANAPTTVKELGLTPKHLIDSFTAAREIRGRFTVLDFAADLGLLETIKDEVLKSSGCLVRFQS